MKILTLASLLAVLFIGCPPKQPRVQCDLQIKKEMTPSPLVSGQKATATVTVTNVDRRSGTACLGPTTVTEIVPPGLTLVSPGFPDWACAGAVCTSESPISPGASVSVNYILDVAATPGTTIQNCATVTNPTDTNRANNESCVTVPVIGQPSGCVPPPANLVEWWPLDETSGTAVNNIISPHPHSDPHHGNSKSAAIAAGGPTPVSGMVGGALNFDGASTYVEVPDSSGTLSFGNPTDNFSIDAWIKVAPQDKSGLRPIVDKRLQTGNRVWGYAFFLLNGRLGFQLADGAADNLLCEFTPSSCTNYISNVDVADGEWRHVAVTVQRTGNAQVVLYVNGSPIFTGVTRAGNANNNASLLIGREYLNAIRASAYVNTPTPYFKGAIDELEIFSRALAQDEIKSIFAAGSAGKCRPGATECCEFELRLFNNLANTVNKIRIVPVDPTKIVHIRHEDAEEDLEDDPEDSEPTEYKLQQVGSSYEITHISGFVPAHSSEMIDEEFIVRVSANTSIRVEWLDANGHVLKSEQTALKCDDPGWVKEDYPWEGNTTTISGAQFDEVLFAGAEREECDPDAAARVMATCDVTPSLSCNQLTLKASQVPSAAIYDWVVKEGKDRSRYDTKTVDHKLTKFGSQSLDVTLSIKDKDKNELCFYDETIDYCRPRSNDVHFDISAQPDCPSNIFNGYNVTFFPRDSACEVAGYNWTFGDGDFATEVNPTHLYTKPGTYFPTLQLAYKNGCPSQTSQQPTKIIVDKECRPKFQAEYEMCPGAANQNILVTVINQSNEFCKTQYLWDFDGTGFTQDESHLYANVGSATVTHRMLDAVCKPNGVAETSAKFPFKPIPNSFTVKVCDDGMVTFESSCQYDVKWNGVPEIGKETGKLVELRVPDGTYTVVSECYDDQAYGGNTVRAKCVKREPFTVERKFCKIRKETNRELHKLWPEIYDVPPERQIGNDLYRMKYKFKAKFENYNGKKDKAVVVSRTKLKYKKCKGEGKKKRCRWKKKDADEIIAGFEGTFRQDQTGTSGCRGDVSTDTNVPRCTASSASSTCKVRSTAKRAKTRSTDAYLVHRDSLPVRSIHQVTKGGIVWRIELEKLANSCSVQVLK